MGSFWLLVGEYSVERGWRSGISWEGVCGSLGEKLGWFGSGWGSWYWGEVGFGCFWKVGLVEFVDGVVVRGESSRR